MFDLKTKLCSQSCCRLPVDSLEPLDEMKSGLGFDDTGQFTHLQSESRILEGLLHGSTAEWSQITSALSRATIGVFLRQFGQCYFTGFDLQHKSQFIRRSFVFLVPTSQYYVILL